MINSKEMRDYVARHLKKGFSINHIKKALLDAGHSEEDVIKALKHGKKAIKPKKPLKKMPILIIILSITIVIVFGLISFKFYTKKSELLQECMSEHEPQIYRCIAHVTGDLSLCDKSIELKSKCLFDYVFFKKMALEGIYPCERLLYKNIELLCKAMETKDRGYCDLIKGNGSEGVNVLCISIVSNEQSCYVLAGEARENCERRFTLYSAISQNNVAMCEPLRDEDKIYCEALISRDPEICEQGYTNLCKGKI